MGQSDVQKIVIAFETKTVPGFVPDESLISVPGNYSKPETIERYRQEKLVEMATAAADQAYTGTLSAVRIFDLARQKQFAWPNNKTSEAGTPVALAAAGWLMESFPGVWNNDPPVFRVGGPRVVIIGFRPRLFLRMLGLECSVLMPGKYYLPLSLWYNNNDIIDIESLVWPSDFKFLSWPTIMAARGLQAKFADWTGPGHDTNKDLLLATELAAQLCLIGA